jgi:hypothetical protein
MQPAPVSKYRPFPPVALPNRQWPNRTLDPAPALVQCRSPRRQPSPRPAHERRGETRVFRVARENRLQGNRGRFPVRFPDRIRFLPPPHRGKPHPRRRRHPDPLPVPRGSHHPQLEALRGAKNAIFHLYNSTSPAQRKHVFNASRDDIKRIATQGTAWVKQHAAPLVAAGTHMRLEYSPESFTSTELDFALGDLRGRHRRLAAHVDNKIILNLPATVEYATPNVHADQIEWMCTHLTRRDRTLISLHTHNDRGTGVAATELAMLAGADRVEGTLFGNGERTGNLDIVTVALNLYTHGVHPGLDFSDINRIRDVYERTRARGPAAPSLRRRVGVHRLQRLPSGRHQEILGRAKTQRALGCALHSDRPRRHRPQLQGHHPHQLPVRQRRRRLRARKRVRLLSCPSSCTRRSAKSINDSPTPRAPSSPRRSSTMCFTGNTSSAPRPSRCTTSRPPSTTASSRATQRLIWTNGPRPHRDGQRPDRRLRPRPRHDEAP